MKKTLIAILILSTLFSVFSLTVFAADTVSTNYGYINDFQEQEAEFGSSSQTVVAVQMFDSNGTELIYNCAPTIKINNITYTGTELVLMALSKNAYADFVLNEDEEIVSINYSSVFPEDRKVNATLKKVSYINKYITADLHFNYIQTDCVVLMAVYDANDKLINATWKSASTTDTDFSINLYGFSNDQDYIGYTAKLFFWDSFQSLKPLNVVLSQTIVPNEDGTLYGYVLSSNSRPADFGESGHIVQLQLLTQNGIEAVDLKANTTINLSDGSTTYLYSNEWTNDNSGTNFKAISDEVLGKVIQFSKNSIGCIYNITCADYNSRFRETSRLPLAETYKYDANNLLFQEYGYIDPEALILFVSNDQSECKSGTVDDLKNGYSYQIMSSYINGSAMDNTIIVLYASVEIPNEEEPLPEEIAPSNLAVITEIGNTSNENGENIWAVSYMINGEVVPASTTPEVAKGTMPTIGDLVKTETDVSGIITKIVTVWDFAEGIRVTNVTNFDGTEKDYALPVANAELIAANSIGGEAYYGGYVTDFYKASKIMVVGGKEFKLSSAKNIYVVDTSRQRISIDYGSTGDFGYNQMLYSGANTVDVYDSDGRIVFEDLETSTAQKYADHVYVRLYEDRPVDVFIVKGADLSFE